MRRALACPHVSAPRPSSDTARAIGLGIARELLARGESAPIARSEPAESGSIDVVRIARAFLGASVLLVAGPASASPGSDVKVVVLPIATEGEVGDVARQRIESALNDALATAGISPVEATGLDACADTACLQAAAEKAGATHALQLRVTASGRDYTTEVSISDTAGAVSRSTAECAICGFDEVADVVHDEAATLAGKVLAQGLPARLRVVSEPAGAIVTIDGNPAGQTPLEVEVPPGKHQIRVEKDGYVVAEDSVTSLEGVEESLNLRLRALPKQRDAKMIRGGWAAVGVGIGLLAGSGVLWGIHHRPVRSLCTDDEDIDVNGVCRWRYEAIPYAVPMTVLGVAGVVTGAVLISVGKRGRKERNTSVAFSPSGVSIAGRF